MSAANGLTSPRSQHDIQKKYIDVVNTLSTSGLAHYAGSKLFSFSSREQRDRCVDDVLMNHLPLAKTMCSLAAALEFLSPNQRRRVVNAVLDAAAAGDDDNLSSDPDSEIDDTSSEGGDSEGYLKGRLLGSLGVAIHTIPDGHQALVETISGAEDDCKAWAILGLGENILGLSEAFRSSLVTTGLDTPLYKFKAIAICGLGKALSGLIQAQRNQVYHKALVIQGIGCALPLMSERQRTRWSTPLWP